MKIKFLFPLLVLSLFLKAQTVKSSSEILHELKKLQNSTTVLYLAAHPDDENTRMISWLNNGFGARTAYMSLTRGDGGQNLIGTELGAKLGILRTQELMQARQIDGGEQFFSRAVDFGYSKTADETIEKWGNKVVLSDVVWVIRNFKPDVIITRFPPDKRAGHGHHTASAMLGIEAFKMAADKKAFPEQLKYVDTWEPKRIYWNASVWWNKKLDSLAKVDDNYVSVEVGGYSALQGTSYNELASLSRTQHKSQGFGVSVARGQQTEYLQYLAGDKAKNDLFEGVSPRWDRFGFEKGDKLLADICNNFNAEFPEKSVKDLLILKKEALSISEKEHRNYFVQKVEQIIVHCLGLHAEVLSPTEYLSPSSEVTANVEILARRASDKLVKLSTIKIGDQEENYSGDEWLEPNQTSKKEIKFIVKELDSQPYWLRSAYGNLFDVKDQELIGKPENDAVLSAYITLKIEGEVVKLSVPVTYKFSDRVEGEIIRPVIITPNVVVSANKSNLIFTDNKAQEITLSFQSFIKEGVTVNLKAQGWQLEPSTFTLSKDRADKMDQTIVITPTEGGTTMDLKVLLNNKELKNLYEIDYSHINKRLVFEEVAPKLVKIDLKKKGKLIGYIPGAGDKVADAIEYMGYKVEVLDEARLKTEDLSKYQAIVAGIRAYNTQKWLPNVKGILLDYVKNGGNYIVQYNTRSRDLLSMDLGPYPFEISRERVTEEDAEVKFLLSDHSVLNQPNKIEKSDFEGWVQERGLYFASTWSSEFKAPLGWHDKGEPSRNGGLIIGDFGKGAFIYTGISFFREVPVGVPGAYRLLANLLSYSNPMVNEQ